MGPRGAKEPKRRLSTPSPRRNGTRSQLPPSSRTDWSDRLWSPDLQEQSSPPMVSVAASTRSTSLISTVTNLNTVNSALCAKRSRETLVSLTFTVWSLPATNSAPCSKNGKLKSKPTLTSPQLTDTSSDFSASDSPRSDKTRSKRQPTLSLPRSESLERK